MTVERVGVVGAGFMGSGIAETAARAGVSVAVFEPAQAPLDASRERITKAVTRLVDGGKLEAADGEGLIGRITWTDDLDGLADCGLVIEAVVEDIAVKGPLFERLDGLLAPDAVIASNTSSIPIAQLAAHTTRPQRVVGLHFFSPVPVMKLVEVVVGLDSSPEAVATAKGFGEQIGKTTILTKDRSGFIVNFLLVTYLLAAIRMLEEGFATREDIDTGMRLGAAHPMGPLTLCDFVGLDIVAAVGDSLWDEFRRPEYAPPPLLRRMIASGHLGKKSGRGFYDYHEG